MLVRMTLRAFPGWPYPLGPTWDGSGVNFSLFSEHAEAVELCIFEQPYGQLESTRVPLQNQTDFVWHAYLPRHARGCCTAIAPSAHTIRAAASASTRTNC